jgi:cobalt-zinc-cadmium efflux system membrane fusion protein
LIPKRSSHSTEALITENNKILFCFKEEKKQHYFFKKVAVKIGEKSENMLKLFQVTKLTLARKF